MCNLWVSNLVTGPNKNSAVSVKVEADLYCEILNFVGG
ncbi:MAG: hypothetical protein ACI9WR_001415 [Paracoccaceae bacterium]|jgi:hypothetical protein